METQTGDQDFFIRDFIDHAVDMIYPARPIALEFIAQRFRFAAAGKRGADAFLNQFLYPLPGF